MGPDVHACCHIVGPHDLMHDLEVLRYRSCSQKRHGSCVARTARGHRFVLDRVGSKIDDCSRSSRLPSFQALLGDRSRRHHPGDCGATRSAPCVGRALWTHPNPLDRHIAKYAHH